MILYVFPLFLLMNVLSFSNRKKHNGAMMINIHETNDELLKKHNKAVDFYKNKIEQWGNSKNIELVENKKTFEIYLRTKIDFHSNTALKLKWKYFLNTCDFFPFKEVIGEYLMTIISDNPEMNNELFINSLLLTYEILYYLNPSPEIVQKYYNLIWFKDKPINNHVFKIKLHKKIEFYYREIISKNRLKSGIYTLNDNEKKLAEELNIEVLTLTLLEKVFSGISDSVKKDKMLFSKDKNSFYINKYNLDKDKVKPLLDKDLETHKGIFDALDKFVNDKTQFFTIFAYVLKSHQLTPLNFYSGRYQLEDKKDWEFYLSKIGQLYNNCMYVGPLIDLFDLRLKESRNEKEIDFPTELEFTSFNDCNLYLSKKVEKDKFMFNYFNYTISNEKLLLEFRPSLLNNLRLSHSVSNFYTDKFKFDKINTLNTHMNIIKNENDYINIPILIKKKWFSSNQFKLCKMISCGGDNFIVKYLDDETSKKEITISSEIFKNYTNYDLYNLMRVLEYDDYISTFVIEDMEKFTDNFKHNKRISFFEDTRSWVRLFQYLMNYDKNSKSYTKLLEDYIEISYYLGQNVDFIKRLDSSFLAEYGNYYYLLQVALDKKFILFSNMEMVLKNIKEEIEISNKTLKKEILSHYKGMN